MTGQLVAVTEIESHGIERINSDTGTHQTSK
jgi:hypothetical protein